MRTAWLSLALYTTALALPVVEKRQTGGDTANEFTNGGCRDIIFIFARGSTESGNIGTIVGPYVSADLKASFSSSRVATQGVTYDAGLSTNFLPGGADPNGVQKMASLFQQAYSQCPNSVIVAGGYSQGAAVTHEAISNSGLSSSVISKIVGVVLFGDTQYAQDSGRITNYPTQNTLIICAPGDLVCDGTLIITAAHLSYGSYAQQAANFLKSRINAAGVS